MTGGRRLVPSHVVVGGRAVATHPELLDTTLLAATREDVRDLEPEHARVVRLCTAGHGGLLAMVEIAAHLRLALPLTRIVVSDLIDTKHLTAMTPLAKPRDTTRPDPALLQRVLDGLHRI